MKSAAIVFLQVGIARRREAVAEGNADQEGDDGKVGPNEDERREMLQEADAMMELAHAWEAGQDPACLEWDCAMTWIVGRKALAIDKGENWMVAK